MDVVATPTPLPEPDGNQDRRHRQEEECLHDRADKPSMGDYPCESSHSPPTV